MERKQVSVFFTIKDPSQADKFEPLLAAELRKEATRAATESGAHFRALTSSAFASILRLYGDGKNAAKHGKEAEILVSLLLEHARELDTPDHLILVTRTTIDSTFHPEYLSAVTYAFLHSGLKRSRTIYQPPIFFLEDYGQQRWLTRYASMMLAQTSLSSLTDPFGMPLPKSTFTMVLGLLRSIDYSWEPNINIKPFNIGIWTKCWLATIGRMSLQPIFLPVYRSGRASQEAQGNPVLDDNSVRRPEQGPFWHIGWQIRGPLKAQVLSMLELVHMWTAIPLAWYSGKESALKKRRIFSLMVRSVPPFCSVCWAHIVLSNWFIAVLLNLICVVHDLYWNWPPHNDEWCLSFTLGFTAVFLSTTPAFFSIFAHVDLHKLLPPAMTDAARAPSRTQWQKETTYTNFTGALSVALDSAAGTLEPLGGGELTCDYCSKAC
ncbi:unnamed protein product [Symbiodinium microadriaticum]|nr:unnamed protein product [Symbiodinium microadriaticum]